MAGLLGKLYRATLGAVARFWRNLRQDVWGMRLEAEVADRTSALRAEAEAALVWLIEETNVPPGAVSSGVINGGPGVCVKLKDSIEWFVDYTYIEAAEQARAWVVRQGSEAEYKGGYPDMSRAQRREFDARRKKDRKARHSRIGASK